MECSTATPRAPRYPISAPLVFRRAGSRDWLAGRTVNISRSGVLFEAVPALPPVAARIEFVLALSSMDFPGISRVRCVGRVVRRSEAPRNGSEQAAATIDRYRFLVSVPQEFTEMAD